MRRIRFVISCLVLFFCEQALAQQSIGNRLELEADPIAFLFAGYSFHVGYTANHFRFDAGVFGIDQPSFAINNDKFSVFTSGIGVKVDYILQGNKGLFLGLQSDYSTDKVALKIGSDLANLTGLSLGLRGGYRFMLGKAERQYKGLYLVPWMALIYLPNPSMIQQKGQQYNQSNWSVFPTIHLGYRF